MTTMPFSSSASNSVTLAWSPGISANVVGYGVNYGLASGDYTYTIYVAGINSTNATITGLNGGATYYFAVVAVDSLGAESPFSNEVSYSVPTNSTSTSPLAPTLATASSPSRGEFALTVYGMTGSNYVVQVSTDLVSWTSVLTNTAPFTYVDTNAGQFSLRFYRAFYLP